MPCIGAIPPQTPPRQLVLPLFNITRRDLDFFFLKRRMSIRMIAKRTGHDRETITAGIDRVYSAFISELGEIGYHPPQSDFKEWKVKVSKPTGV